MTTDYRHRFHIPKDAEGREKAYLCGHSLGLQPKTVRAYVEQELEDWERLGVEGHFHARNPWVEYGKMLAAQTARLVGAQGAGSRHHEFPHGEPASDDGFLLPAHGAASSHRRRRTRFSVRPVCREVANPASTATIQRSRWSLSREKTNSRSLLEREGESIALVLMAGINYSSGRAFDLQRIARAGHRQGCTVGFDLAHAAGNLVLKLHDWHADFAVWCTYKYLNAGPGSIGGCFIHERHANAVDLPRFAGWWGHELADALPHGTRFPARRRAPKAGRSAIPRSSLWPRSVPRWICSTKPESKTCAPEVSS